MYRLLTQLCLSLVSLPSPYTRRDSQHVAQVASLEEELEGHLNDIILEYSARVSTYLHNYVHNNVCNVYNNILYKYIMTVLKMYVICV